MSANPPFLFWMSECHTDDIGIKSANFIEFVLFSLTLGANSAFKARNNEVGIGVSEYLRRALRTILPATEEEKAVTAFCRSSRQGWHKVRTGNSLRQPHPECARGPHERHAIGE